MVLLVAFVVMILEEMVMMMMVEKREREGGANMEKWVNRPQEFGDLKRGCNKDE